MANTKYHEIEGNIVWANNLFVPDEFAGNSYYKCNLEVDLETRDKFRDSGVRTKIKPKDNGSFQILLKRPAKGKIGSDGKEFGGGEPMVYDTNGDYWDKSVLIGNNSRVKVKYVTYDANGFAGHRLESVTVLELVPYDNERREREEEPSVAQAESESNTKTKTPKVPF